MKSIICVSGQTCIYYVQRIGTYDHQIRDRYNYSYKTGTYLYRACKQSGYEKPIRKYKLSCKFKQTHKLDKWISEAIAET